MHLLRAASAPLTCAIALAGCLDFTIQPGTLRCDREVSPPCPSHWVCVAAPGETRGFCYPEGPRPDGGARADADGALPPHVDGGSTPGADGGTVAPGGPPTVGPGAAPAAAPPGKLFHVDPQRGSMANPGSEQEPWSTLAEVLSVNKVDKRDASGALKSTGVVKPGDALVLYDGDHGQVDVSGYFNADTIYVVAAPGQRPRVSRIVMQNGANWWLQGLTVTGPCGGAGELVRLRQGSGIAFIGNTVELAVDRASWTVDDWKTQTCNGITVLGSTDTRLAFNTVRTASNGIFYQGSTEGTIERNDVDGFTDKGMMLSGPDVRTVAVRGNVVRNCHYVGRSASLIHVNTCTGCQGIAVTGNRLLAHAGDQVPAAFSNATQGLVFFDGGYDDISIENNVVVGDHWHGITVLKGSHVTIINNTTVGGYDAPAGAPDFSQIQVTSDAPATITVRNNLTNKLDVPGAATVDHNGLVDAPDGCFVDWRAGDYRLRAGSPAVDQGNPTGAPSADLGGRPRDSAPDQGAYERISGDP